MYIFIKQMLIYKTYRSGSRTIKFLGIRIHIVHNYINVIKHHSQTMRLVNHLKVL